MTTTTSVRAELERRSARAELLAKTNEAAREPLQFVSRLFSWSAAAQPPLSNRFDEDVKGLLQHAEFLFRNIAEKGPEGLVEEALKRLDDEPQTAVTRLTLYWNGETNARDDYLSRAILRPYAEALRNEGKTPDRLHKRGHCPFCGGAPIVSSRRSLPDAEAGARMLHCGLCALEWNVNRIQCPSCFEESPDKLPVYSSDAFANVRIEACETCRRYVKSIDLTLDARPIPEIDDLASISMDLWAIDEGLTRIEPGWAGV